MDDDRDALTGGGSVEVTTTDVLEFVAAQRLPARGGNVVRLDDGERGLSARTIARRLATLSGLNNTIRARCAAPAITVEDRVNDISVSRSPSRNVSGAIRMHNHPTGSL